MTKTTVQYNANTHQFTVTIPRTLAEAIGLTKGNKVDWIVLSKGKLSLEKTEA